MLKKTKPIIERQNKVNGKGYIWKIFLLMTVFAVILAFVFIVQIQAKAPSGNSAGGRTFFEQFVVSGGVIVWFVLIPMSLITGFLAAEYFLTIRRKRLLPADTEEFIIETLERNGFEKLQENFADRDDLVTTAVYKAITGSKGDLLKLRTLLAETLQDQASGLLRKIEWLNLIGNVSPMVGLFGTVYGMIKLFNAIVLAGGQPQPAQLADGISVALVTTFWGLIIAIPAIALYGFFRNRIEAFVSDAVTASDNIMPQIRICLKKQILAMQDGSRKVKQTRIGEIHSPPIPVGEVSPNAVRHPLREAGRQIKEEDQSIPL